MVHNFYSMIVFNGKSYCCTSTFTHVLGLWKLPCTTTTINNTDKWCKWMLTAGAERLLHGLARIPTIRRFTKASLTSALTLLVTPAGRCDRKWCVDCPPRSWWSGVVCWSRGLRCITGQKLHPSAESLFLSWRIYRVSLSSPYVVYNFHSISMHTSPRRFVSIAGYPRSLVHQLTVNTLGCNEWRPTVSSGVYSDTTQLNSTSSCRHVHSVNNCHLWFINERSDPVDSVCRSWLTS